ncbi:MarR family winged helix-turn-helix transcriptional regulator [Oricola thermophila]|uniref:Winged helix-turn-helix transcriptional regulator n=1 Tax=Oricola thermophila TaxID=2742145 RepID=A0A6N1VE60_9HYPH|nr:MarR family winged helix-turn-helix transcriptional regulator [Oricola thermophila]QKV17885.1 winged helix-turn-helix transcriptional regulator [Oricola thermophila]
MPAIAENDATTEEEIDLRDLTDSIGFLTRLAQVRTYEVFFEDLGSHGLRPGEFSTLLLIGRNPGIRQGLVAQTLRIKPAHMTKLIRAFEDRGLVERTIPDHDRRSVRLTLTEAGREFLGNYRESFKQHEKNLNAPLTDSELVTLRRLLRKYAGFPGEEQK